MSKIQGGSIVNQVQEKLGIDDLVYHVIHSMRNDHSINMNSLNMKRNFSKTTPCVVTINGQVQVGKPAVKKLYFLITYHIYKCPFCANRPIAAGITQVKAWKNDLVRKMIGQISSHVSYSFDHDEYDDDEYDDDEDEEG